MPKNNLHFLKYFSFLFLMMLSACGAFTRVSSVKGPGYTGKIYHKIMVEGRGRTPKENLDIEWTFRNTLQSPYLSVVASTDIFPLTQNFTEEEKKIKINSEKIEGVLIVSFKDKQVKHNYSPPDTTTTTVKNKDGKTEIKTQSSGGYNYYTEYDYHDILLVDTESSKPVWSASASTQGDPNDFWSSTDKEKDFISSLANKSKKKMAKDGLIQLPEK